MAVSLADVAHRLREFIAALDGRAPRTEHATEAAIAQDAAVLRARAVNRLAEIGVEAMVAPQDAPGHLP